jgi:hypothetical protein
MGGVPNRKARSTHGSKPFQPAVGREFGRVEDADAPARDFLTRFIAGAAGLAVSVTGAWGLSTGNYTAVIAVWAIAGPIIGAVVTYYFGPDRSGFR